MKYVGGRTSVDEHAAGRSTPARRAGSTGSSTTPATSRPSPAPGATSRPRAGAAHDADPEFRTLVTTQLQDAEDHGVADGHRHHGAGGELDGRQAGQRRSPATSAPRTTASSRRPDQGALALPELHEPRLRRHGEHRLARPSADQLLHRLAELHDRRLGRRGTAPWSGCSFLERRDAASCTGRPRIAFPHDAVVEPVGLLRQRRRHALLPGHARPASAARPTSRSPRSALKMIREGMEDYEYLKAPRRRRRPASWRGRSRASSSPTRGRPTSTPEKLDGARARHSRPASWSCAAAGAAAGAAAAVPAGAVAAASARARAAGGGCGSRRPRRRRAPGAPAAPRAGAAGARDSARGGSFRHPERRGARRGAPRARLPGARPRLQSRLRARASASTGWSSRSRRAAWRTCGAPRSPAPRAS